MVASRRFVPVASSGLSKLEILDISSGYNSFDANDVVKVNQPVYLTDNRIPTLGRAGTRRGSDFYSVPAGEAANTAQTSTTGAGNQSFSVTTRLAAKVTTSAAGRLTRVDLNLRNTASATGPVMVEVRADSGGSPGALLATSSVAASTPTSSYAYCTARFIEAPALANATVYWYVVYIQDDGTNSYQWSSTSVATTSKTSSNSGVSWSAASFSLNIKTYLSTDSPTLGIHRAYKSTGTRTSLLAHGTDVYTVNDATGALTSIKSSLNASATRYEFVTVNDTVYYVNGVDAPRKWDFTTEAAASGSPAVSSTMIVHKNMAFYVDAANPTRVFFSNPGSFETFTSTDFVYVPAPKSPDPITKLAILNDNLVIFTRRTKWVLYGSNISNMILRKATGTKGCASPDSVQVTRNYIYFASDDGFYAFNGSTDKLLSESVTGEYAATPDRVNFGSGLWNGRYYIFHMQPGDAHNTACWVYNIQQDSIESLDLGTFIMKTMVWEGAIDNNQFLQASNLVGAIYYAEQPSNSYNNLGRPLSWEIRLRYEYFDNPAALKQLKRWYPRFKAQSGNYTVFCQIDKDFADAPSTGFVYLRGDGSLWGSFVWGSFTWGSTAVIEPRLNVPGSAQHIQRRYKRSGVNMPVEYRGESLYYKLRRPK